VLPSRGGRSRSIGADGGSILLTEAATLNAAVVVASPATAGRSVRSESPMPKKSSAALRCCRGRDVASASSVGVVNRLRPWPWDRPPLAPSAAPVIATLGGHAAPTHPRVASHRGQTDCHMAQALLAAGRGCARLPTAEAAMQYLLLTECVPDAKRSAIMRRVPLSFGPGELRRLHVSGPLILDTREIVSMVKKMDGPLHASRGRSQTFAAILASAEVYRRLCLYQPQLHPVPILH
jgi:hypothetical protein